MFLLFIDDLRNRGPPWTIGASCCPNLIRNIDRDFCSPAACTTLALTVDAASRIHRTIQILTADSARERLLTKRVMIDNLRRHWRISDSYQSKRVDADDRISTHVTVEVQLSAAECKRIRLRIPPPPAPVPAEDVVVLFAAFPI